MRLIIWGVVVRLIQLTLACLLVSACSGTSPMVATPQQEPDWGKMSLKLKPLMSEQEVIDALGQPGSASFGTCGQATGKPWACRTLVYGLQTLRIYLKTDATGTWRVVSWSSV